MKTPLSRRERQIMDVVYRRGEATVSQVLAELPDPPSYSAVRSTLRILEEKQQLMHRRQKGRYIYRPWLDRKSAAQQALQHLKETFFKGSAEELVVALLDAHSGPRDEDELDRISKIIEEAKQGGR